MYELVITYMYIYIYININIKFDNHDLYIYARTMYGVNVFNIIYQIVE